MVHGGTPLFKKKVVTLCVPKSTRRSGVNQWVVFNDVHVVFDDVRVVFYNDVRWYLVSSTILIPHTPFPWSEVGLRVWGA